MLLLPLSLFSQSEETSALAFPGTNFSSVMGSGARAFGMGGAFIAIADDATAASWNPAGLNQLDLPEVSIVGAAFYRNEDNTFGAYPDASGDQSVTETRLNYFSATYPFLLWGRNMVASINYQHLYDFTRDWNFTMKYIEV